jgi:glucose/arabinose dehydrogenase
MFLTICTLLISIYSLETIAVDAEPTIRDPNLEIEIIYTGIKFPTNMAFLGSNDILALEKNEGTVKRITDGHMLSEPLLNASVNSTSERGMLGIAVADNRPGPTYVFLYYTEVVDMDHEETEDDGQNESNDEKGKVANRLYRYELVGNKLVNPLLLFDLPGTPGPMHNGGEIATGPDGNLYVTVGDVRKDDGLAQNNLEKEQEPDGRSAVLRITQEGKLVDGEGILGNEYPLNMYYAYGIRNSFGLDFDSVSGKLWDTENGPNFGDEINVVEQGFNSGWKKVQGVWEFTKDNTKGDFVADDKDLADELVSFNDSGKYSAPEFTWDSPPPALTGIAFLDSKNLGSEYENDLFIGAYNTGQLYHFDLNQDRSDLLLSGPLSDKIGSIARGNISDFQQVIFGEGFGGITDVQTSPDGYLYVLALYQKGTECRTYLCQQSDVEGTIFRIAPKA